jgi:hypothetical protein
MHIVSCYYEKQGRGIYNVATLWDRRGAVIGKYRKVHLPVYETWLVRPGNSFPAFKTDIGKVAMTICYDQMWPESVAACALNGAEIVCMPSAATPDDFRAQTRALDNQVFFITSTPGTCVIVAPNGTILTRTGEKPREVVHADANVHGATLARKNFFEYLYSGIQDHKERHLKLRRPRAYAPITCPAPALMKDYPKGGLAINPRDIRRVYEAHKQETQRRLRGEKGHYDWRW